jgi:hypothetical protein
VLPADFANCASQARLAGWFFYSQTWAPQPPLAADQLQGWVSPVWQDWPSCSPASRWIWLPRLQWLAPARVRRCRARAAQSAPGVAGRGAAIGGRTAAGGDGYWEEVARGFVVPTGWPEQAGLQQLMASIAGCSLMKQLLIVHASQTGHTLQLVDALCQPLLALRQCCSCAACRPRGHAG